MALLSLSAFSPSPGADPQIPTVGGIIVQTNITGLASGVAGFSDGSFVISGDKVVVVTPNPLIPLIVHFEPVDGFLAKYNNNGTLQWIRTIDTGGNDTIRTVVSAGSSIYAISFAFGTYSWLYKFDSSGNEVWNVSYNFPGATKTRFTDIAFDGDEIVVGGHCVCSGDRRAVVVVFDSDGSVLRDEAFEDGPRLQAGSVAVEAGQAYYLAGIGQSPYYNASIIRVTDDLSFDWGVELPALNNTVYYHAAFFGSKVLASGYRTLQSCGIGGATSCSVALTTARSTTGSLSWEGLYDPASTTDRFMHGSTNSTTAFFSCGQESPLLRYLDPLDGSGTFEVDLSSAGDFLTLKYDADGILDWAVDYNDGQKDAALGCRIVPDGSLPVVGTSVLLAGTPRPMIIRYTEV